MCNSYRETFFKLLRETLLVMIVYRYRQAPLIDDLLVYRHQINAVLKKIKNAETDETSHYQCCIVREHLHKSAWRPLAQKINEVVNHIFLIGVGGSSLGVRAVYEALCTSNKRTVIHFLETVDEQTVRPVYELFKQLVAADEPVCLLIASKSGTTFETNILANLFVPILQQAGPSVHRFLIVLTDEGSPLFAHAQKLDAICVQTIKHVGGRFSVFTVAGLFPLACIGVDIDQFCSGAYAMVEAAQRSPLESSAAGRVAAVLFWLHQRGIAIHETFLFSPAYESVGKWYRQLAAETLGKSHTCDGRLVETGMFPSVAIGTTDLHSIAQLLFAGPRDKMVSFTLPTQVRNQPHNALVINQGPFQEHFQTLVNQSMSSTMKLVFDAVVDSYAATGRFCMSVEFVGDAYGLGEYMMSKLLEVLYSAELYAIDPFSQPAVELYKKGIRDKVCW